MEEMLEALCAAKQFIEVAVDSVLDPDATNDLYDAYRRYLGAMEELPNRILKRLG